MSPASNTVDEAAGLIRKRIKELDAERAQLERALASLTGGREGAAVPGGPAARARASSTHQRSPAAAPARRHPRRPGRRSWSPQNPGISASEIAKRMKIKPNYLYRVLAELEKEGKVRKDGRAYHPAG